MATGDLSRRLGLLLELVRPPEAVLPSPLDGIQYDGNLTLTNVSVKICATLLRE